MSKAATKTTRNKNTSSLLSNTQLSTAELTAEVAKIDFMSVGWNTIESKFQELKAMLSAPTSGLNASQARVQQKQAVSAAIQKLLDMAQTECRRLLVEGNAKAAVEGGLKTLELKKEYFGTGSLQLVSSYFHLARTNQYMDKFKRAEEFLSLAQYEILRHPEADVSLKAELHQTFGLLYASDGKLDAALKHLTCATYYLAVMNGPEHILTSFGYFDLGNVFAAKSNMENAMAFYDKVKDTWYSHLKHALQLVLEQGTEMHQDVESVLPYGTPAAFGEENIHDSAKMLRGIVGLQRERFGQVHPNTAKAEYVLGMFLLWNDDTAGACETLLRALEIMKREYGERHPNTGEVRTLMLNFGMHIPDDTSQVLDDGTAQTTKQQQIASSQDQRIAPPAAEDDEAAEPEVSVATHRTEAVATTSSNEAGEEAKQEPGGVAEEAAASSPNENHAEDRVEAPDNDTANNDAVADNDGVPNDEATAEETIEDKAADAAPGGEEQPEENNDQQDDNDNAASPEQDGDPEGDAAA